MWPLIDIIETAREEEFELWFDRLTTLVSMNRNCLTLPDKEQARKLFDQGSSVYDAATKLK